MFLVEIEKRVKRVPRYLHYNNSPAPGPLFRRFDQDSPGCPAIYSVINNKLRGGDFFIHSSSPPGYHKTRVVLQSTQRQTGLTRLHHGFTSK